MMFSLGARCCGDCRSLAVLAMLSLGNLWMLAFAVCCRSFAVLVLSTAAVAVHLLSLLGDALSWCSLLLLL
ncbi:hypothetical protein MAM1_0069d04082 [Mucor ambiguus]|uniref:Uncharacterized protein n=1 Tax=Mucor ambiguus TaxID=91626 RepID=A0A0C9M555_9FUNG|nr:hypothetical protein MAM1_0069d04082 [Mucor ambiguus]